MKIHNNIDKNKQIRKYYLHIVIFADFMPFRVRNTLLSFFLRQQKNNYSFVCFYDNRDNSDNK